MDSIITLWVSLGFDLWLLEIDCSVKRKLLHDVAKAEVAFFQNSRYSQFKIDVKSTAWLSNPVQTPLCDLIVTITAVSTCRQMYTYIYQSVVEVCKSGICLLAPVCWWVFASCASNRGSGTCPSVHCC